VEPGDPHLVGVIQTRRLLRFEFLAIEMRSVRAAQVDNVVDAVPPVDAGMVTGDVRVIQDRIVVGGAADGEAVTVEEKLASLLAVAYL
jgi:hypothetical protein